jgi:hypothetical protein
VARGVSTHAGWLARFRQCFALCVGVVSCDFFSVWELYVCAYVTTICYECDYYFGTVFAGGCEGYAETVSFEFISIYALEIVIREPLKC